ncbi:MAG: antitermination protein NusG [Deltaproteobacteria bacterium]|nr:MAG: antitermination protein NusG [Deltaproteobacteria bacterium]
MPNILSGEEYAGGRFITYPSIAGKNKAWFAVYVQVRHEKEVYSRFQKKSIDCFLPLLEKWSKRKDRRKKIWTPLFPGYIFVNTVLDNYTNVEILRTQGVVWILKNSEGPLPIPDYQIESLRKILDNQMIIKPHPYLREGEMVKVVNGPLAGCIGILLKKNDKKGKLVASIDIIKKAVSVELNIDDVEPVNIVFGHNP